MKFPAAVFIAIAIVFLSFGSAHGQEVYWALLEETWAGRKGDSAYQ